MRKRLSLLSCAALFLLVVLLVLWEKNSPAPGSGEERIAPPPRQVAAAPMPRADREDPLEPGTGTGRMADWLASGELLHVRDQVPSWQHRSTSRRMEIHRVDFRDPLIRVERRADGTIAAAMVADHLLVKRRAEVSHEAFVAKVVASGLHVRRRLYGDAGYLITAPSAELPVALETIAAKLDPSAAGSPVHELEPDFIVTLAGIPNDREFFEQQGMDNARDNDIDAPEAWDIATESSDVIVGVIDTGIDLMHPDLAPNLWTNPDEIVGNGLDDDGNGLADDVHGYDFANGEANPSDDNGHGTHCAGTIGAVGDNRFGVAGVTWSVRLMGLKVLNAQGVGSHAAIIEAIGYASDQGAHVTSNSYGSTGISVLVNEAILAAGASGCLYVAAAGNDGTEIVPHGRQGAHTYVSSSGLEPVVSVAATDDYDGLASFSNYGSEVVHLAAPGVDILSTIPGGGYGKSSGTSMATPHVSGACALLLGRRPDLTVAELKERLMSSVDRPPSLDGLVVSSGRLNLHRLIAAAHEERPEVTGPFYTPAVFNAPFACQITTNGSPLRFAAKGLPVGLAMDPVNGVISGTPVETGIFTVTVQAINDAGAGSAGLVIAVAIDPPLITSAATAGGKVYAAFRHRIVASGEVAQFESGALPSGLSLDPATGVISGTPLVPGEFLVEVRAINPLGVSTQQLAISIAQATAPQFQFLGDLTAVTGQAWSVPLEADGLPTRFAATGLPPGLSLDPGTGIVSGTPTATGSFVVQVEAENSAGIGSGQFTLTVNPATAPVLTTPAAIATPAGQPFAFAITATQDPVSFAAEGLPDGLSLGSGGLIEGTPPLPGVSRIGLSATNAHGTGRALLKLSVLPAVPVIDSPLAALMICFDPFIYQITASGEDPVFAAQGLPPGLRLERGTGRIVGTVLTRGLYPITISATNAGGTSSVVLQLLVLPRPPVVTSKPVAYVEANTPFSYRIEATNEPDSHAVAGLPSGLALDPASGRISGMVATPGTYALGISATNAGGTGSGLLQLIVHQNPTRIDGFTPSVVTPGEELTLTGAGFSGATEVLFGGPYDPAVPARAFTVVNDGELRVVVPTLAQGTTPGPAGNNNNYLRVMVLAPRGLGVTFPAATISVTGATQLERWDHAIVENGGAAFLGGTSQRVLVKNGGSAQVSLGGGNTLFLEGGAYANLTNSSAGTLVFRSPAALLAGDPSRLWDVREVSSVRATILPYDLRVKQVPEFRDPRPYITAFVGEIFEFQIRTASSGGAVSYGVTAPLPPGLSMLSNGLISGIPRAAGEQMVEVSATNSEGTSYHSFRLIIEGDPVPVITSPRTAQGDTAAAFGFQVTAVNNPQSFSATGLPPGLEIGPASGLISGTPLAEGVFHATIAATNAYGSGSGELAIAIGVSPLAVHSFSPVRPAEGTAVLITGRGFNEVEQFYFLNNLRVLVPDTGRTLVSDSEISVVIPQLDHNAIVSESPVIAKTAGRTAIAFPSGAIRHTTNASVSTSAAKIIVGAGATVTLNGSRQWAYVEAGATLVVTSGSQSVFFLEDGASLNNSAAGATVIRSPGSIILSQGNASVATMPSLSLSMLSHNSTVRTFKLPKVTSGDAAGQMGTAFFYTTTAQNISSSAAYAASGLPEGLSIHEDTGLITGTPQQSGSFPVILTVTATFGSASKSVVFTISPALQPKSTGPLRVEGSAGSPVDFQLGSENGPVTFSASGLPPGLTLSTGGHLTGTASQAGIWLSDVTLTNAGSFAQIKLAIAIDRPIPTVTSIPEITGVGAPLSIGGSGLAQVTQVLFNDRDPVPGKSGILVTTAPAAVSVVMPEVSISFRPGTIVALSAPGGTTVALPQTMAQVPAGTIVEAMGSYDYHVRAGGTLAGIGSGLLIYVERGGIVVTSRGSYKTIYAEDGATIDTRNGFYGTIIAAPNAIVLGTDPSTSVTRVPGLRASPVPGYLKLSPIPVFPVLAPVTANLNVPFFLPLAASNSPESFAAAGLPPGLSLHPVSGEISGTPLVPGDFVVHLTATNAAGSSQATLTIIVGGQDDPFNGDGADADRDTIANLLEYAAVLDLRTANPPSQVAGGTVVNGGFHFRYRRLRGAGTGTTESGYVVNGIRYVVEASQTLDTWSTGPECIEAAGPPTDNGDGSETATVRLIAPQLRFLRLRVERVPSG